MTNKRQLQTNTDDPSRTHADGAISSELYNPHVDAMYAEDTQGYVETTIVLRTPIADTPLADALQADMRDWSGHMRDINQRVESDIGETFESDILRIKSVVKRPLSVMQSEHKPV